jgi:hypothetical protein
MKKILSVFIALLMTVALSTPAAATKNAYDRKWGTFTTVTLNGQGTDVVELSKSVTAGFLKVTHDGESNFIVRSLKSGLSTHEYLVNEIGQYEGSVVFGMGWSKSKTIGFEVEADGDWSITILPMSKAPTLKSSGEGTGVFKTTVKTRKSVRFSHTGSSNFIVRQYCTTGSTQFLVNEIGAWSGRKVMASGTCIVEVVADGSWTIK